ncbi:MAG: glycosyltransferase family 2 protein [Planctomycetota bacterium]
MKERGWTVVVPAYDEEATIAGVVEEYRAHPDVERVLVVNNRSTDRTRDVARAAGAEVIDEPRPGYGCAIRAGLDHALETGAVLLAVTEGDGTFRADDLPKFRAFLEQHDIVFGTRTHRVLLGADANLGWALRWGNRALATLLAALWWFPHEPALSDVGCTYRALWPEAWRAVRTELRADGPDFAPEMMCLAFDRRLRVVQIPVQYGARRGGSSKHSEHLGESALTALGMLVTICRKRLLG